MKNIVITIGREYGSGGRYIGEVLSERLNIPFYDKEIISKTYEKNGGNYSKLLEYDEKKRNKLLDEFNRIISLGYLQTDSEDYDELMERTIKDLANESCIILGRSANKILENKDNVINVFIYSKNLDFKIKRKMQLENIDYNEALKRQKEIDKNRKSYYESLNKGSVWGDKKDYDILIDSYALGIDKTVCLLEEMYKLKSK